MKLSKIAMKNDDDFLIAKLFEFITITNFNYLQFSQNFGLKNDGRFSCSKINRIYYTEKNKIISKVYQFTEHFFLLLAFSYLLPVPVYVVRVPPLTQLVCCVSTLHCRSAGILLSLCVWFAVLLDGRGLL
jgi:hypothetical protein